MTIIKRIAIAAFGLSLAVPAAASADTYFLANFSGSINPGGANVKAPFTGSFTQSDPISGHFVYDANLIPGAGTINVFESAFPDIALIPSATAFHLVMDGLTFDFGGNIDALLPMGVQYKNGVFNGFEYISDFGFGGSMYQFRIDGPTITVKLLTGIPNAFDPNGFTTGGSLINAKINVAAGLTNVTPFTPTQPGGGDNGGVPEPAAWALMILGFGAAGAVLRRRRAAVFA
jgi:hypothetical protein